MQEDEFWVKQTLNGDEQAFHRLIIKYYSAIYAMVKLWVKNPEDAKDLTQEIFLEAYRDLAFLKNPEQFRFWLRQIAKHQCQDWLRKRQETIIQLDDDIPSEMALTDEVLIAQETLAKVMQVIDELPESEKLLLKDRYLDDLSYDKLESKYGLSQNILSMRLYRARQRVREKLKMLTGIFALTWQDTIKKALTGGSLAMKISAKVKIIISVVGVAIILGGTSFIIWHYQQSSQEIISDTSVNQVVQKALPSEKEQISAKNQTVSDTDISRLSDNKKRNANDNKDSDQIVASMKNLADTSNIDPKLAKKIDVYNGLMRLLPAYRQATQSAENLGEEIRSLQNSDFLYNRERFPDIYRISYGPDGTKVFNKQEKEITDNREINSFIDEINKKEEERKMLASKIASLLHEIDDLCPRKEFEGWTSENPPQRITGVVTWIPNTGESMGNIDEYGLAKWLGKELPWDGNTNYNNAKDFSQ